MLEPSSMLKEIKQFEEQSNDNQDNENVNLRERQQTTKLSNCEKELKKKLNK